MEMLSRDDCVTGVSTECAQVCSITADSASGRGGEGTGAIGKVFGGRRVVVVAGFGRGVVIAMMAVVVAFMNRGCLQAVQQQGRARVAVAQLVGTAAVGQCGRHKPGGYQAADCEEADQQCPEAAVYVIPVLPKVHGIPVGPGTFFILPA